MSNTLVSYDLSYESEDYPKLIKDLTDAGLTFPASHVLHALTFGSHERWVNDLIAYTLVVDRVSCEATVIRNNLVA